jgi:acetylornithine deacetylase/succinyl-diaminopimelate desuccinylase-like protein
MKRLHAPNEFFRIRGLREGTRAWEELWRPLADGPHRPASRAGDGG